MMMMQIMMMMIQIRGKISSDIFYNSYIQTLYDTVHCKNSNLLEN